VRQVTGERGGEGAGGVADRGQVGPVPGLGPGERPVHPGQQRIDLLVLGLHRVEHGLGVLTAGEPPAQGRPDDRVLGRVMQVELALEQLPARLHRRPPPWIGQVGERGRPGELGQVAPERRVRGEHDRQVRVAGPVPGRVATGQVPRGHEPAPMASAGAPESTARTPVVRYRSVRTVVSTSAALSDS